MGSMFPKSWLGGANIHLPYSVNLIAYLLIWVIALVALYVVVRQPKAKGFFIRWTTQDILIVAIMGVLLEVYDNLIGDQFITPIISLIPFGHAFALNDFPYMFLLMVGVAMIRKPGAATAMVFLNFMLMQLLYGGSESGVLWWPYGIFQGICVDLYMVLRGGRVFQRLGGNVVVDGLIMGALRAVPAAFVQQIFLGPFLSGWQNAIGTVMWYALFNLIGNGLEAGITAPLAIRVARSVNQSAGQDYMRMDDSMDSLFEVK